MRNTLFTSLFLLTISVNLAQLKIVGVVKDINTNAGIPYCPVVVKNNQTVNTITNEDGAFMLEVSDSDTLQIKYIGYKSKVISVLNFRKTSILFLLPINQMLTEVVVRADNDYLYKMMDNCRKVLIKSKTTESKVYFFFETFKNGTPVELLECFYNGKFSNSGIKQLDFKNGRAGLVKVDNGYFISTNTSKAVTFSNLVEQSKYFPAGPFHFNIAKLKKKYTLKLMPARDEDSSVIVLKFEPKNSDNTLFSGEVRFNKKTFVVYQIKLSAINTSIHPFESIHENGTIRNVSFDVTKNFKIVNDTLLPESIYFNYTLNYKTVKSYAIARMDTTYTIDSKGVMFFYDYHNPFFKPYYNYDDNLNDYRKIISLNYNKEFWQLNKGLVYSKKAQAGITFFKNNGIFLNFKSNLNDTVSYFDDTDVTWSGEKRLSLKKNKLQRDTTTKYSYGSQPFLSSLYTIEAQIFLDVNKKGDSLVHFSVTVFDVFQTFYNLPEEKQTNCFINIYFDLCEIERRKMEHTLSGKHYAFAQIDSIYKASVQNLAKIKNVYMKEVFLGRNKDQLKKWNDVVYKELNIDNFMFFKPYN